MTPRSFTGVLLCWLTMLGMHADLRVHAADASLFGEFVGSSPCGPSVRPLLGIPVDANADLVEWKLSLYQSATGAPANFDLECKYGVAAPGTPGLSAASNTTRKQGQWTITTGTKSEPMAVVYDLRGALSLLRVGEGVLHVLNPDRSLMVGNGGWSYTLNQTGAAEQPGNRAMALARPSESYSISPLASGPSVFGVFEGRTPYRGIARELNRHDDPGRTKAEWRITLFQHPDTHAPTMYRIEGTLHHDPAREGTWTIVRGAATDPRAVVYRLGATTTAPTIFLLKGDDNVLFFLNQQREPLVGHAEFSYTLNRVGSADPATQSN